MQQPLLFTRVDDGWAGSKEDMMQDFQSIAAQVIVIFTIVFTIYLSILGKKKSCANCGGCPVGFRTSAYIKNRR